MNAGLQPGSRVHLRPRARGDVLERALAGKTGRIASVERDGHTREIVFTVVLEAHAGRPGHRFFFYADEIEPL